MFFIKDIYIRQRIKVLVRELTIIYANKPHSFSLFFDSFNPFKESLCKHLEFFGKTLIIHDSYYLGFAYRV